QAADEGRHARHAHRLDRPQNLAHPGDARGVLPGAEPEHHPLRLGHAQASALKRPISVPNCSAVCANSRAAATISCMLAVCSSAEAEASSVPAAVSSATAAISS